MGKQSCGPFGRRDILKASAVVSGSRVLSTGVLGAESTTITEGAKAKYELTSTGNGDTQRRSITSEVVGVDSDDKLVTLSTSFEKDTTVVTSSTRQFKTRNLYLNHPKGTSGRFSPLFAPQGTAVTEDGILQRLVDPTEERKTVLRLDESQNVNNDIDGTSLWLVPMLSPVFAGSE